MKPEELGHENAMTLWLAAVAGEEELAYQLRRLDLSDENESVEDARVSAPDRGSCGGCPRRRLTGAPTDSCPRPARCPAFDERRQPDRCRTAEGL